MNDVPLILVFLPKCQVYGEHRCAVSGESLGYHGKIYDRWEVCRLPPGGPVDREVYPGTPDGTPVLQVCDACVEYHAPELIPAQAAANALREHLDAKRAAKERQAASPEELPF
jgi:hypothetical protein